MNDLREFSKYIAESIKDYLPTDHKNTKCEVIDPSEHKIDKRIGLAFIVPGRTISPIIYMDKFYEMHQKEEKIDEIMKKIVECFLKADEISVLPTGIDVRNFETVKEYLTVCLINTAENKKLLETIPHYSFEDMSIIYQIQFSTNDEELSSIKVTNDLMRIWNITHVQLHAQAVKNAMEKEKPVLCSSLSMLNSFLDKDREPENLLNCLIEGNERENGLFVLTTRQKICGAKALIYPTVLDSIVTTFPEGFYIMMSSIHEAMIVSKKTGVPVSKLKELVEAGNMDAINPGEKLSDNVYSYDGNNFKKEG